MPLKTDTIEEPAINLTPMVDVVFLLIIFFMVGSRFTEMERQYNVQLPAVADAAPLTSLPDEIVVNVRSDGTIVVKDEPMTLAQLQTMLNEAKQNYADQAVSIRGDKDGRYQYVMDVLAACNRADIKAVSLPWQLQTGEQP